MQTLLIWGITGANDDLILAAIGPPLSLHFNPSPSQPHPKSVTSCLNVPPSIQPLSERLLCAGAVRLEALWMQAPFLLPHSTGLCLESQPYALMTPALVVKSH